MSKYFTYKELTHSDTAKKYHIFNEPDTIITSNLDELMSLLDKFRAYYGKPIKVTSGYRSIELNAKVGGVKNSAHTVGYAADLIPADGNFEEFKKTAVAFFKNTAERFDQVIIEKSKASQWIHIGIKNLKGEQRRQVFKMNV